LIVVALLFAAALAAAVVITSSSSHGVVHFRKVVARDAQTAIDDVRSLINDNTK
jgi:hypothetical protein